MHRFHLSPAECRAAQFTFSGREAHHALRVLRLGPGDEITILDGAGVELLCKIEETRADSASLQVLQRIQHAPASCSVTLFQSIPKGKTMEWIIEKATELGVSRIVPLLTERCVVKLAPEERAARQEKWQQVAVEAVKQCGQPWLPRMEAPQTLRECLARDGQVELPLIGALGEGAWHPRACFEAFRAQNGASPKSAAVWIGPEGDFTPGETMAIKDAGAQPITFGPLVLRVETAAIYALSIISYETRVNERAPTAPRT